MPGASDPRRLVRLATTATGAVTKDAVFVFDPSVNQAYVAYLGDGFEAVQVTSPSNTTGNAADLEIAVRGDLYALPGGGNTITIPGPVTGMRVTPRNASVTGTGSDNVRITPFARYKVPSGRW